MSDRQAIADVLEWEAFERRFASEGPDGLFDALDVLAGRLEALPAYPLAPGVEVDAHLVRLVSLAVRRELPTLRAAPELLFQTLWNRLHWHDAPAAAEHFPGDGPWRRTGPKAWRLAERWRASWLAAHPGEPWLESVRPLPGRLEDGVEPLRALEQPLHALGASRDGRLLGLGLANQLQVWDLHQGRLIHALEVEEGEVRCLAWDESCKRLAGGTSAQAVMVWDATRGELLWSAEAQEGALSAVAWSPDGQRLAAASLGWTARVWTRDGQELQAFRGHEQSVHSVTWSPDGTQLATGCADGLVRVFDVESGALLRELPCPDGAWQTVAWSPDGAWLAGSAQDGVRLWRTEDWSLAQTLPLAASLGLGWLEGLALWSCSGERYQVLTPGHTEPQRTLTLDPRACAHAAPLGAGARLAVASEDGRVLLLDVAAWRPAPTSAVGPCEGLWVDREGQAVVATGPTGDAAWRRWDATRSSTPGPAAHVRHAMSIFDEPQLHAASGRIAGLYLREKRALYLAELDSGRFSQWAIPDLAPELEAAGVRHGWHPDGLHLWLAAGDGVLRVFNGETGATQAELALLPEGETISAPGWRLELSPRGDLALLSIPDQPPREGRVVVWQIAPVHRFLDAAASVSRVRAPWALSAAPYHLLTAHPDGQVRVWDLEGEHAVLIELGQEPRALAISPDSSLVAASGPRSIKVWRLPEAELIEELRLDLPVDELAVRPGWVAASGASGSLLHQLGAAGSTRRLPGRAEPRAMLDDPLWIEREAGWTAVRSGRQALPLTRVAVPLEAGLIPGPRLVGRGTGTQSGTLFSFQIHGRGLPPLPTAGRPGAVRLDLPDHAPGTPPARPKEPMSRPKGWQRF